MPYKDNYKDYQNDTLTVRDINELKRFIKKGSLIFVFDKPLDKLNKIDGKYWGHMLIVSDWYTNIISDSYTSLNNYEKLDKNQDFQDIGYIKSNAENYNVSFKNYLKYFVFIEAQLFNMKNQNKKQGFERDSGVMLTAGNDERFQTYLDSTTCVAVVNINEGYKYSHPDLINNMIKNALNQLGKKYNMHPNGFDNDTINHYCSGLAYYSLLNGKKTPSLRLLKYKHISNTVAFGFWYMPRTVCNSPFVYTRVWKIKKQ